MGKDERRVMHLRVARMGGIIEAEEAYKQLARVSAEVRSYIEAQAVAGAVSIVEDHKDAFFSALKIAIQGTQDKWQKLGSDSAKFGMASAGVVGVEIKKFTGGIAQRVKGVVEEALKEQRISIPDGATFQLDLMETICQQLARQVQTGRG